MWTGECGKRLNCEKNQLDGPMVLLGLRWNSKLAIIGMCSQRQRRRLGGIALFCFERSGPQSIGASRLWRQQSATRQLKKKCKTAESLQEKSRGVTKVPGEHRELPGMSTKKGN